MTEWTRQAVWERMVAAFEVESRLPGGGIRPAGDKAGWPASIREWSDHVASAEQDTSRWRFTGLRSGPDPREIDDMDEALDWLRIYPGDAARKCLATAALAEVLRVSIHKAAKECGWSRPHFYRLKNQALDAIADGLNRAGKAREFRTKAEQDAGRFHCTAPNCVVVGERNTPLGVMVEPQAWRGEQMVLRTAKGNLVVFMLTRAGIPKTDGTYTTGESLRCVEGADHLGELPIDLFMPLAPATTAKIS